MRITQRMVTRNYLSNLNSNYKALTDSNARMTSGRKFNYLSENLADGSRALRVRRQLSDCYEQKATVRDTEGWVDSAWGTINDVNSAIHTVAEKTIRAKDDSHKGEREIIGSEIGNLQAQIMQQLNIKFADKNVFGGSNNTSTPFTTGPDGNMLYNGIDVNSIKEVGGKFIGRNPATGKDEEVPYNEDLFVDLGNGMTLINGEADERTAFKISFSGLDIMGFGTKPVTLKDGSNYDVPNNLYNIIGEIEGMLKDPTKYSDEKMGILSDKLEQGRKDLMLVTTDMDNRASYLETVDNRIESDIENLTGVRGDLEGVKDYEEIMKFKMYEFSWMATLKMGSSVLPQSLMDFMR